MAAGAFHFYDAGLLRVLSKGLETANTFRALLVSAAYNAVTGKLTHDELADVVSTEISGDDYARQAVTMTISATGGAINIDFEAVSFGASVTIPSCKYMIVYDDTEAGDPLIGFIDLNTESPTAIAASVNAGFNVTPSGAAVFTINNPAYSAGQ